MYAPLARAFDILRLLANAPEGLPVSTISKEVGIAKSATHRLLASLVKEGYVAQHRISERYGLTLRLPVLGFHVLAAMGITDVVQPILDRLAKDTRELVRLGLVDSGDLIWVAWSQGSQDSLRYVPSFGRELVLHTTASGTAWLASMPNQEALRIVRTRAARRRSKAIKHHRNVLDEKAFLRKLAQVRRDGYGLNLELAERGINAVAMTVETGDGESRRVVGTLSVAGPSIRMTEQRLTTLLPILRARAREVGEVWPMHVQITATQACPGVRRRIRVRK